jgi:hypothetical protein
MEPSIRVGGRHNGSCILEIISNVRSHVTVQVTCVSIEERVDDKNKRRAPWLWLLSLRWVEMKFGLVIEESQDLQRHLNLMTDLTGRLARILNTISSGRWLFFLHRRIAGCEFGSIV